MKYTMIVLVCVGLMGCVTSTTGDNASGWSFVDGGSSPKRYAYAVASKSDGHPVRSGDTSLRFEVRAGDCGLIYNWNDCVMRSERKELRQGDNLNSGERWYSWSIYLPEDYPVVWQAHHTNLGQFHNKGNHMPLFMFRALGETEVVNGEYAFVEYYKLRNLLDNLQKLHWRTESLKRKNTSGKLLKIDDMRGLWSDFLVHVKWTSGNHGFFRVYVNGSVDPSYEWFGPTKRRGYGDVFFKFGIYTVKVTDKIPARVVYYDDVRKGRSCKEITSYFDCDEIVGKY